MRPVRLTLQAFGPFPGREVIDFREAVEAGLFGIYGQTGSGKSTIFSAMTFALFGEPAKSEQEAPSLRSDHAPPDTPTEVEFVFDIGERRLVILRRPEQTRPKQRGDGETRSPHEAFLFDASGMALERIGEGGRGKILAEKKVRDIDAAVADLLGYGPAQFRQIVLLPQGRFEAFLAARTKERIGILRDLFDVSLYRALADRLKADGEAAERAVREEREVCARRLAAEGFESTDALAAGIAEAETRHAALLDGEKAARAAVAAAQTSLAAAERIEARFREAEAAETALVALEAGAGEIEALAKRVVRAERARSLLDAEGHVAEADAEMRDAAERMAHARRAATDAEGRAREAAEALERETGRADEIDEARRRVEALDRCGETLERTAGLAALVARAEESEREAAARRDDTERRLAGLLARRGDTEEALTAARQAEGRRQEIAARLAALEASLAVARTFERAVEDVRASKAAVGRLTSAYEATARAESRAQAECDAAERALAAAQALHLASRLASGEPCPVCGATEHPAPATGAIGQSGLDRAFRDARAALREAADEARRADRALTAEAGVLREREERLSGLARPEESTASLSERIEAGRRALDALGPRTDIDAAEAGLASLAAAAEALDREREACRDALAGRQREAAAERARLDAMLAAVPVGLRAPDALAAARAGAVRTLAERQSALDAAARAATAAREAALAAGKEREAAEERLAACRSRHAKALDAFGVRLAGTGLSWEEFRALKPAIGRIEQDRAAVDRHRQRLASARDAAARAAEAVRDQPRPDLEASKAALGETEKTLDAATDLRSGAWHRLDHLRKLRDALSETLVKLDEAEAASGPLRNLAALFDGKNPQSLDLETFAIGTMFDRVLAAANLRLGPMTARRYRLERDLEGAGRGRRGLGIRVFDIHTGKARPTATLSGGETFIAALALALGLADVVESASGKVRLDTIFIDEGFGSLDTENGSGTLEQVLQVLGTLVSENRAVGLISHVPLVQEAIPNGFHVRKTLAGSSVEARGVV